MPDQICIECGRPIPARAPSQMCPGCLLQLGLNAAGLEGFGNSIPSQLGGYELLEEIARGGMGVVFRARDPALNRVVAVKAIASGQLASPELVRRFRIEAEAAARLDHPHIVPIYEIGEQNGLHFFSMRLIEGGTLQAALQEGAFAARESARLIAIVARAVHHAHERGVLHRDLKPTNILLDLEGKPHLTDFGLAKLLEIEGQSTVSESFRGTPAYMAPEQAAGRDRAVTTASDLYSLGAVLYQLLSGRPPFVAETPASVFRQILETEPTSLTRLNPAIDADLATICHKCLEKEPARRYSTAAQLADDLERWRRGEPIQARPVTQRERLYKWARRRPAVAALVGLTLLLLVTLAIGSTVVAWHIGHLRSEALRSLDGFETQKINELLARDDWSASASILARRLRHAPASWADAERLMWMLQRRHWYFPAAPPFQASAAEAPQHELGMRIASDANNTPIILIASTNLIVVDLLTGKTRHSWPLPFFVTQVTGPVNNLVGLTATARVPEYSTPEDDRTNPTDKGAHSKLYVLNYETGQLAAGPIPLMVGKVTPSFDSLGSRIAAHAPDGSVRVYAIPGTQEVLPALSQTAEPALGRTVTGILSCRFTRQDRWICAMDKLGALRLWDSATGSLLHPPMFHEGDVSDFGISPDGTRIAVSTAVGFYLWDSESGQCISRDTSADSSATWRFTRDGKRVLLQISREKWKLLDAISGRQLSEATEKAGAPEPFASTANSVEVLLTPAAGQFLRRFDAWTGTPLHDLIRIPGFEPLLAIEMIASNQIGTCSLEGVGMLWSPSRGQFLHRSMTHSGPVQVASFSPDGDLLVTASADQTARIWNVASGNPVGASLVHSNRVYSACWSPDGKRVATASWDGTARLWDAKSGSPIGAPMQTSNYVFHVEFDPAGRRLLVTGEDPFLRVYDALSGQPLPGFQPPSGAFVYHACFSPDGRKILTRPWRENPQVWDATQGSLLLSLPEPDREVAYGPSVQRVAISRDGRWAAAASPSGYATLWDLQNGQFRARLLHAKLVRGVVFSPDSQRVLTFAEDRTARVWQVPTGRPVTPPMRHDPGSALGFFQGDGIKTGAFSPDGRRVVTGGNDGTVRLWDGETGLPLAEPFPHAGPVLHVEFSPDGRFLASASADGTARVWEVPLAEGPVPSWLIDLAEGISTRKLLRDGSDQKVSPVRLWPISQSLTNAASNDRYERWGARFFGHAPPALAP